ncbi:ABC transporter permease [Marinomonas pollencensis]|uniref:Glycine betaine/proline transport system permease protein n=1 Tax=Marinomonas pollencensis TaxID=491954 RepID=A0A3E0DIT3_9GAMM|nr:ABC transporter permease subunit [Marinomonas pollencensis]REG81954.1 glycine betaine/proline transport system permease protein [Marinomonas pollencensis]
MSEKTSVTNDTDKLTRTFVQRGGDYYVKQFARLSEAKGFKASFQPFAGLFGPIWFASRGLWSWFLCFLLIETFGFVQLIKGLFGDLGSDQVARAESIQLMINSRLDQIETARAAGSSSVAALERAVASLQTALDQSMAAAHAASSASLGLIVLGIFIIVAAKAVESVIANWTLETQFTRWRSNNAVLSGFSTERLIIGSVLFFTVTGLSSIRFAQPDAVPLLLSFPANNNLSSTLANGIGDWFDWAKASGGDFFNSITLSVRSLLDGLETIFVGTPWPVVVLVVAILSTLTGGPRVAVFTVCALAYLGVLGFWEKAMATISLLGAAAMISIVLGVPFGILCARKPKVFMVARPVLDFMQSMPSFVYLIPVIAFFGAGKPSAIIATLVFGSPPVIRLTVLGLQQVPHAAREAAMAFGATPAYLLFKVDLPLASKTIMTGVNQTILMSLAMVVVASLIGAKGLGEDVLSALQYASEGEGILAGIAILFCALILDKIVAGKQTK